MSSYSQPRILSFKAAAAMAKGVCVKAGADREHVAICSAATDKIIGISQTAPTAADEMIEVATNGGGAKAKLGGTVSMGDKLTSDASGLLVATTTENDNIVAVAMEDGVANDIIGVEVALAVS